MDFLICGYDNKDNEYILRHNNIGAIPDVWKFDVSERGPIIPGCIHLSNYGGLLFTYTSNSLKWLSMLDDDNNDLSYPNGN